MNLLRKNTGIGTEQKRSRRRSFYDGIFLEGAPSANAESKRTCRPFSNVSAGGLTVSPPAAWKFFVMESLCFGIGISPFSEDGQNPEDRILPGKCSTGFSRRTRVNILLFFVGQVLVRLFFLLPAPDFHHGTVRKQLDQQPLSAHGGAADRHILPPGKILQRTGHDFFGGVVV